MINSKICETCIIANTEEREAEYVIQTGIHYFHTCYAHIDPIIHKLLQVYDRIDCIARIKAV